MPTKASPVRSPSPTRPRSSRASGKSRLFAPDSSTGATIRARVWRPHFLEIGRVPEDPLSRAFTENFTVTRRSRLAHVGALCALTLAIAAVPRPARAFPIDFESVTDVVGVGVVVTNQFAAE